MTGKYLSPLSLDAALAVFVIGDEALRSAELGGELHLGEALRFARSDQELAKRVGLDAR